MMGTTPRALALLFAIHASIVVTALGQEPINKNLTKKVTAFEMTKVMPSQILDRLAKTYGVLIGVEAIAETRLKKTEQMITIKVAEGTVRDVLNRVVKADPRYTWMDRDNIVNVFPKDKRNPLLETMIRDFKVNRVNREEALELLEQLPGVKAKLTQGKFRLRDLRSLPGEPISGLRRFSLNLHNVSVRTILNEITKASDGSYWLFFVYGDRHEFVSLRVI